MFNTRTVVWVGSVAFVAAVALANPPPPAQQDPVSLDRVSPSVVMFGNTPSDLYGDLPPGWPGTGWDVGGPGPILHVAAPALGLAPPLDNITSVSNGEFFPFSPQILFFSVDFFSPGMPGTPVRHQFLRRQSSGDRWMTNGIAPQGPGTPGPFPVPIVGPFFPGAPPHVLSANQTRYNEIPSIPPGAPNLFVPPVNIKQSDELDALELNPIDLNNDFVHETWVYFTLDAQSPALLPLLATGGDILVAPPRVPAPFIYAKAPQIGITPADQIDGLAVWDLAVAPQPTPGDVAIFSLAPGSPFLAGPDGLFGTVDDYSPADVFLTRFNGAAVLYVPAAALGLMPMDNIDALDVEPIEFLPQVFDWWVQMVNIDVVFFPPPFWPPGPADDFHVLLGGIDPIQVFGAWTGDYPVATVTPDPLGTLISWSGATTNPGQTAHFGWIVSDNTPANAVQWWWTKGGLPAPPLPDVAVDWQVLGNQTMLALVTNRSTEPVMVQRRFRIDPQPVRLADLMVDSPYFLDALPIDPGPVSLPPGGVLEWPMPAAPDIKSYGLMYELHGMGRQVAGTFLNAFTVVETDPMAGVGACCFYTNTCIVETPEFCELNGGRFKGLGTMCTDATCPPCAGDINCDWSVTFSDIDAFVEALGHPAGAGWPHACPWLNADCNGDGAVTFSDIDAFVSLIGATCP